jgi:hypothetical protein
MDKQKRTETINFCLTKAEAERLDKHVETENTKLLIPNLNRSDIIRRSLGYIILNFGNSKNPEIKNEVKK